MNAVITIERLRRMGPHKAADRAEAGSLLPPARFTYPQRRARAGRLTGTSVIAAAVLLAGMPSVASAAVQPKPGTIYTGGAGNEGKVTLELKRTWNSTTERVYMAPFITWTEVMATCDIWNGTEIVPTPKRITACGDREGSQGHHLWDRHRPGVRLQVGTTDLRPRGQLSPRALACARPHGWPLTSWLHRPVQRAPDVFRSCTDHPVRAH